MILLWFQARAEGLRATLASVGGPALGRKQDHVLVVAAAADHIYQRDATRMTTPDPLVATAARARGTRAEGTTETCALGPKERGLIFDSGHFCCGCSPWLSIASLSSSPPERPTRPRPCQHLAGTKLACSPVGRPPNLIISPRATAAPPFTCLMVHYGQQCAAAGSVNIDRR